MDNTRKDYQNSDYINNDVEEYNSDEEEEDDPAMALIVEDDETCQEFLEDMLKNINIRTRCAATVSEAKQAYLDLERENITTDIVFLDIYLKDNSTGIDFLKIIRENNWMEKSLIIVMSGIEDSEIVKQCYNYNIQNFIRKPITRANFLNETYKINKHLESLKCPLKSYKIEKRLGAGSSGVVHLIRHKKTKELFAMKTVQMDPSEKNPSREKEVQFYKNLKSPTILELREYQMIDNNLYIVLEYAEFGTLNQHIIDKRNSKNVEKFSIDTILDWISELFIGLYVIHEKHLMHRDIKADNLFICKNQLLKIGDLGIARATETGKANTVVGTVYYMAPEIFHYQNYTNLVDIWAAGVVLYEMIMLKKPFDGMNTDIIKAKIINNEYEPVSDKTDERLRKLIRLCLEPDPKRRASATSILSLSFINERVLKLFENKLLVDEDLYKTMIDISKKTPTESFNPIIQDDCEQIENFKTAIKIDSMALKSFYKPGMFSKAVGNVIKGSDLEMCASDLNIQVSQIENLLKQQYLMNIVNPKLDEFDSSDNMYYRVTLYEDDKIDNSIICKPRQEILDPVRLSAICLETAENIWNNIREQAEENMENAKNEILSSRDFFNFLTIIKQLKNLKMSEYNKNQKLATTLNIYQTMLIHLNIKNFLYDDNSKATGIVDSVKGLFRKACKSQELTYNISGQSISLYEMKNIVIRRNRKPLNAYFKLANASDARINFIDENPNDLMLLKFLIICPDPMIIDEQSGDNSSQVDPRYVIFNDELRIQEVLDDQCKGFVSDTVKKEENFLYVPKLFKDYIVDFDNSEQNLIKTLLKLHTDTNLKPTGIIKAINSKELVINYY